jgi:hypothetical protein
VKQYHDIFGFFYTAELLAIGLAMEADQIGTASAVDPKKPSVIPTDAFV